MTNLDPNSLLDRSAAARALTEAGYPTADATLATKACRGGGPAYRLYGRRAIYEWRDLLSWAESRTSSPRCSTSEADGITKTFKPASGIESESRAAA